jgi:glycosyltransferase involved in cell wall biosynthesis
MIRVLLLHSGIIPHYRVPIYGYLSNYLKGYGFDLIVASDGIQAGVLEPIEFSYFKKDLSVLSIARLIHDNKVEVIIDFMELKHPYLFPTYFISKGLMGKKLIYWGQGRDLLDAGRRIKNLAYAIEQSMCSAIILYAEHLKKYVPKRFENKIFIANNTLCLSYRGLPAGMTREKILTEYGIGTHKNIACIGRMQERKRVNNLVDAFISFGRRDIGLILVGPDPDGVLSDVRGENIFKLGPIYGDRKYDLLSSADVCCLPGAVGLSIVDAFYCGLPFVTEEGDESAEIMYLKDGANGFIVPRNNIPMLRQKLLILLDNENLRKRFSAAAKREISEYGNMDLFCSGFRKALCHTIGREDSEYAIIESKDAR